MRMTVVSALSKGKKGSGMELEGRKERKHQAWPAAENPPVELAVRGPPQGGHPFLYEELVMMEPAQVCQEIVRMCLGLHGNF